MKSRETDSPGANGRARATEAGATEARGLRKREPQRREGYGSESHRGARATEARATEARGKEGHGGECYRSTEEKGGGDSQQWLSVPSPGEEQKTFTPLLLWTLPTRAVPQDKIAPGRKGTSPVRRQPPRAMH